MGTSEKVNYDDVIFLPRKELPNPGAVAYRYDELLQGGYAVDEYGDAYRCGTPTVKIYLSTIPVRRFTPKGYWVGHGKYDEKFVCHHWRKKFAHLNEPDAALSYRMRKKAQIRKLTAQLEIAKQALNNFERGIYDDHTEFNVRSLFA